MTKQLVGHFACQSFFNTVGQPGGFKNGDEYHRFAVDCGFTCVTMPVHTDLFNLDEALMVPGYYALLDQRMKSLGYVNGLYPRIETHVISQNVALSWTRKLRFGFFVVDNFATADVAEIEKAAVAKMKQLIDVAQRDGIKHLICFFGGKGYAVGQSKWSAWPQHFPKWVLAALAYKWNDLLEYAADRGVVLYHECFHPENDILTGANFVTFYNMLTPKARKGCGAQLDISHLQNVGVNPIPHIKVILDTGCPVQTHYKGGVVVDRGDGTCSALGGWQDWSEASHTFVTVGIIGDEEPVREFHSLMAKRHHEQVGGVPIIYEAECVALNMRQGMQVGAKNCIALRDGGELIRIEGFASVVRNDTIPVPTGVTSPRLVLPNGGGFEKVEPILVAFDKCFTPEGKPWTLLGLTAEEITGVREILERSGETEAAALAA